MAKKNRGFSYSRSAKSLQDNAVRAGSAAGAAYTLVGGILVLGGIGYGIDRWQDTSPWGLIIGLVLGVVALFGIRKHGTKGILAPALVGILINGLLLFIFVSNFVAAQARTQRADTTTSISRTTQKV